MPQPTAGDVHVNGPLTNISVAFIQNADRFIATRVFPNVPVSKQSDLYFTYTQGDWFRDEVQLRAPGAESAGGGWTMSTDSYRAHVYAIHKDIDDQTRANQDNPINLDREATEWVTGQLLLHRESLFTSTFMTTSLWTGASGGTDLTGVAAAPGANQFLQWNDAASTPIEDIRTQIVAMAEKTGYLPNTLVLGPEVWAKLIDHPDIMDRIKYTQFGSISTDIIARLLGLDRILVGWGTRNTAAEGATASYDFYWGKTALLCYVAPSPSLMQPSAGYTFSWTGLLGAGNMGTRIKNFRLERNASDRIEGEMAFALKQVSPTLGAFFTAAVA